MEIILSKQCEALTGSLGKGFGYSIQRRRDHEGRYHFYSQRSKWNVPRDGHLKFIFTCAKLARMGLHIADISVKKKNFTMRLPKRTIGSQPGTYVSRFTMPETSLTSKSPLAYERRKYFANYYLRSS